MTPPASGTPSAPSPAGPEPRRLPGERALSVGLRTAHLVAFSVLLGGHVLAVAPERLGPALWAAVATGAGLVAIELCRTLHWPFLVKGLLTLVKLGLLGLVPVFWDARVALLLVATILASVGAHMPARYRNHSVLLGRPWPPPRGGPDGKPAGRGVG